MKVFRVIQLMSLLVFLGAFAACSKNSYTAVPLTSTSTAGSISVPPRVDILVALDDTASVNWISANLSSAILGFTSALDQKNWDYHLATIPLTTPRKITQVAASKYDGNNTANWVPAYPGVTPTTPGYFLTPSFFKTAANYSEYNEIPINQEEGTSQPGFQSIQNMLGNDSLSALGNTSGFLRSDAMLVIFLITNGEDTSGLSAGTPNTNGANYSNYLPFFQNFKGQGKQALIQFYSVVAGFQSFGLQCQGTNSRVGLSYINMSAALDGMAYDFCGTGLSLPITNANLINLGSLTPLSNVVQQALSGVASQLSASVLLFKEQFAIIGYQPDVTSITVTVAGQSIPQCPSGTPVATSTSPCWEYEGYGTENVITSPAPMNQQTGWVIEFSPSAMPIGNQILEINAIPYGAHNTSS